MQSQTSHNGQIRGSGTGGKPNPAEPNRYYYHPDHLGSTSYITDASGEVYQHLEYFAFGETFVEEHSNTDRTPYLYNGKELDEETGLYYYGARYYDAVTSVWVSVDPLAERYYTMSAYNYVANNPIIFIDPDGMRIEFEKGSGLGFRLRVIGNLAVSFATSKTARSNIKKIMKRDGNIHIIKNNKDNGNVTVPNDIGEWSDKRPSPKYVDFSDEEMKKNGDAQDKWRSERPTKHSDGTGTGSTIYIDFNDSKGTSERPDKTTGTTIDHEFSHAANAENGTMGSTRQVEEDRAVEETNTIRKEKNRLRIFRKIPQRKEYGSVND